MANRLQRRARRYREQASARYIGDWSQLTVRFPWGETISVPGGFEIDWLPKEPKGEGPRLGMVRATGSFTVKLDPKEADRFKRFMYGARRLN